MISSERLHALLEHLLAIGNFLNYYTPMGEAKGLDLETLRKVTSTKSNVEGASLMDYLASHVTVHDPDLLLIEDDMPHASSGLKYSLSKLEEIVAEGMFRALHVFE